MGFKRRRDKGTKDGSVKDASVPDGQVTDGPVTDGSGFRHSSGATNLEGLLGEHTLDADAELATPKGYRARSIAKSADRR